MLLGFQTLVTFYRGQRGRLWIVSRGEVHLGALRVAAAVPVSASIRCAYRIATDSRCRSVEVVQPGGLAPPAAGRKRAGVGR
jgi:hypothetical protein